MYNKLFSIKYDYFKKGKLMMYEFIKLDIINKC